MSIYSATIQKMETQLNAWNAQISLLEAKIKNAGSDIKFQRVSELNQLHTKQRVAAEKLKEMKKSTSESWEQVKGAADKIWDDLKTGIAKAHSRL